MFEMSQKIFSSDRGGRQEDGLTEEGECGPLKVMTFFSANVNGFDYSIFVS